MLHICVHHHHWESMASRSFFWGRGGGGLYSPALYMGSLRASNHLGHCKSASNALRRPVHMSERQSVSCHHLVRAGFGPSTDSISYLLAIISTPQIQRVWIKWLAAFTQHSSASFDGGATYEPWKEIQRVSLIPENDLTLPTRHQEQIFTDAVAVGGKVERVFFEGMGHSLHLSATERVANDIVKLGEPV